jgi:hypothetical protein
MASPNPSRAIGAFFIALATAAVAQHFAFSPMEPVEVAFSIGIGCFFLTAAAI